MTTQATERDALLRAVLEDPREDTTRLVFADYLDENGGEGWAYLIRSGTNEYVAPEGMSADVCFYPGPAEGTHYTVKLAEGKRGVQYVVRRGFVDEVRLPLAAYLEHAEALFSHHPITRVVLTGHEPQLVYGERYWRWSGGYGEPPTVVGSVPESCMVPWDWLDELGARGASVQSLSWVGYDTREDALASLGSWCVARGRALAGLPPLLPGRTET